MIPVPEKRSYNREKERTKLMEYAIAEEDPTMCKWRNAAHVENGGAYPKRGLSLAMRMSE
jgi:hypothetical protein